MTKDNFSNNMSRPIVLTTASTYAKILKRLTKLLLHYCYKQVTKYIITNK